MNVRLPLIIVICLSLLLGACARTHVTGVWQKKDFAGPPMQSLMILAQTRDKQNRAAWENIITERFRRSRMDSVPALSAFPIGTPANIISVIDNANKKGIDGVLVIRHVDTRRVETYFPPHTQYYYTEYPYPYWRWYPPPYLGPYPFPGVYLWPFPLHEPYFYYEQEIVFSPGYRYYHQVILVESYLYKSSTGEQVWSMSIETVDPLSDNHLIADISRSVFRGLKRADLIRLTK